MSRPKVTSLSYYNIETDTFQNRKMRRLINRFGGDGFLIYSYLRNEIYRDKGFYMLWDENSSFDVSDFIKQDENLIEEVVKFCCEIGLFNKELFEKQNVLTSKNIQKFWVEVSKKAKRSCCDVNVEYSLLTEETTPNKEETILKEEETQKNKEESTQRKEKKSKVNNSFFYKSESEFLSDWKKARESLKRKPTNIKKLARDELQDFELLKNEFEIAYFRSAMQGLFLQKGIYEPNTLRPRHFLSDRNIEKYYDAFINKTQLYTEKQAQL